MKSKAIESARFALNREDVRKATKNALIFFAPAALIFLTSIQSGKSWQDSIAAIQVWALSTAVDILRKFLAGR